MSAQDRLWQARLAAWKNWAGNERLRCFDQALAAVSDGRLPYPPEMVVSLLDDHDPKLDDATPMPALDRRLRIHHKNHQRDLPLAAVNQVVADPLWTTLSADRHLGLLGGAPLPAAWPPDNAPMAVSAIDNGTHILFPAEAVELVLS